MTSLPLLSFVVPVRNDADNLRRCLESIAAASSGIASEVIVVDNGSTDSSKEVAIRAGAHVLELPGHPVAVLRNRGAGRTAAELIAFVDADHELAPGWSRAGLELLQEKDVSAVGAQYHAPVDGTWVQQMYDRLRGRGTGRQAVGWLPSGNLIVRKKVFERLSGFDEALETCEDVDFCQRLIAGGGRLVADDRMQSVHRGDPRTVKALFFGELWRGRDNLRVSLRGPLTWQTVPSVAIPVIDLVAIVAFVVGLLLLNPSGFRLSVVSAAVVLGFATLRTINLLRRGPSSGSGSVLVMFQALIVALTYDLARALALITRGSHAVRRKD